jgi:branched-chain amino acid transport system substrate-binding protein
MFGEGDGFVLDQVRKQLAGGIEAGGKRFNVEFIAKDTQSNPVRAAQVAKELINSDKVDFVLSTSTPETVNPVADACEAAGVPALSTTSPWEAFYFGRGAKPGEPSPFKWTYHFCFGVGNFAKLYADQWSKVPTNKKVGMLLPADADGNAIRGLLIPALQKAGFTVVDAGPYQNGNADFSAQIALFRKEGSRSSTPSRSRPTSRCSGARRPSAAWPAGEDLQMAKAGLFAAELEALGRWARPPLGRLLAPQLPVQLAATGMTSAQLADGYEKASGKVEPAGRRHRLAVRRRAGRDRSACPTPRTARRWPGHGRAEDRHRRGRRSTSPPARCPTAPPPAWSACSGCAEGQRQVRPEHRVQRRPPKVPLTGAMTPTSWVDPSARPLPGPGRCPKTE